MFLHLSDQSTNADHQGQTQQFGRRPYSKLEARIDRSKAFLLKATGSLHYISDVGQQLGWLSAAIRKPPQSPGLVTRNTPKITIDRPFWVAERREGKDPLSLIDGYCSISCSSVMEKKKDPPDLVKGDCWLPLFANPVLVQGYPILRRLERSTGVEMSLTIMASLARCRQVVQWDDRIIMKGYSMLCVATLASAGMIVWHLMLAGGPGERISYIDTRLHELNIPDNVSLRDLETARHVIGWCTRAQDMCGQFIHCVSLPAIYALTRPLLTR